MALCECGCGQEAKEGNKFVKGHNRRGLASFTNNGKWSRHYHCCRECGTTEVKHRRDGYCQNCARRLVLAGKLDKKRLLLTGWSRCHQKCIDCGTTTIPHKANGRCKTCDARNTAREKGAVPRYDWATGHRYCVKCERTEFKHVARGLCYQCYHEEKRREKGLGLVQCPVCKEMVSKLGQHMAILSKECDEHKKYYHRFDVDIILGFHSDLTSREVGEKFGIAKVRVLKLWHSKYSKDEIFARGEKIRTAKISGENHYLFGLPMEEIYKNRETYPYKGIEFKSSWERAYAKYLDENDIVWEYEKHKFPYLDKEGVRRYYWPDFYLPELYEFVEVKGYLREDDAKKIKDFGQYIRTKGKAFSLLMKEDLMKLGLINSHNAPLL